MAIRSRSAKKARKQNTKIAATLADPDLNQIGSAESAKPLFRVARRFLAASCIGFAALSSTGCSVTSGLCRYVQRSECIDEFMLGHRNRAMAEKAWICRRDRFCLDQNAKEFKDGFVSGYLDIATGGAGCCPTMAPPRYWGWRYQSSHGQAAINAYFAGFPLGVQAAEEAGLGHFQQIPVSGGMMPASAAMPVPPAAIYPTNPDVTNPFYSEEEVVPMPSEAPEPTELIPDDLGQGLGDDVLELDMQGPGSAFNPPESPTPVAVATDGGPSELVSQSELIKKHEEAVSAKLGDQIDQLEEDFPEAAEVVIDDIFGSSTDMEDNDEGLDELPFSFD